MTMRSSSSRRGPSNHARLRVQVDGAEDVGTLRQPLIRPWGLRGSVSVSSCLGRQPTQRNVCFPCWLPLSTRGVCKKNVFKPASPKSAGMKELLITVDTSWWGTAYSRLLLLGQRHLLSLDSLISFCSPEGGVTRWSSTLECHMLKFFLWALGVFFSFFFFKKKGRPACFLLCLSLRRTFLAMHWGLKWKL